MSRRLARPWPGLLLPVLLLLAINLALVRVAAAEEFQLQAETIVRAFQRDTASANDQLLLPVYEYLRLDYAPQSGRRLSLHAYGWVRGDLADSGYFEQDVAGELAYAYLEWRPAFSNSLLRIGRQTVFSGVASDPFDGVRLAGDLGSLFSLSVHGGQPVGYSTTAGRSGDLLLGGRFAHHYKTYYEVGLSYQRLRDDGALIEHVAAVDGRIALPLRIRLTGYASRNLDTHDWGEQRFAVHATVGEVRLRTFYERVQYEHYFPATPLLPQPFRTLAASGEQLTRYGVEGFWPFAGGWELGARGTSYHYDVKTDDARYGALLLNWSSRDTRVGAEVGYLDANVIQDSELLLRLYGYWDRLPQGVGLQFVSAEIMQSLYDQGFFGETRSFFASLGAGRSHFNRVLEWKLSADYSIDPYFNEDLRGMLVLTLRNPG